MLRMLIEEVNDKGLCKERKIPKIRDYYGSGWVGLGLTRFFFLENRPKITLLSVFIHC